MEFVCLLMIYCSCSGIVVCVMDFLFVLLIWRFVVCVMALLCVLCVAYWGVFRRWVTIKTLARAQRADRKWVHISCVVCGGAGRWNSNCEAI